MDKRPKIVYLLIVLWVLLSFIFIIWGTFSLDYVLRIPNWEHMAGVSHLYPLLFFGSLLSTIAWFVFACLFLVFSYGTLKGKNWVWTSGIIFSTIFIVILGLMLASLMVTAILFQDFFSLVGLETVVVAFLVDLGIIYCLTRPETKLYFEKNII